MIKWKMYTTGNLVLAATLISCALCRGFTNESELLRHLLADYHPGARPTEHMNDTLTVSVQYMVRKVQDLDEQAQMLRSDLAISLNWVDHGLKWDNPSGEFQMLSVPSNYIWTPTFSVINGAGAEDKEFPGKGHIARVSPSGLVYLVVSQQFQTACTVDLTYFPFDTQKCVVRIFSNFPTTYINITRGYSRLGDLFAFRSNTEWTDVDTSLDIQPKTYGDSDNGYSEQNPFVIITLKMKRNPSFYIVYLIIPSLITSAVAVLVFVLPADSGERVSLSVTSLLSYTVFLLMVSEVTPRGGQNIPVLVYYITWMELMTAFGLAMNIMVLNIYHTKKTTPMSEFYHVWILKRLGRIFRTKNLMIQPAKVTPMFSLHEAGEKPVRADAYGEFEQTHKEVNKWKLAAKTLDRLMCACFLTMFTVATFVCLILFASHTDGSGYGESSGQKN